jgi:hypothetical protein
VKGHLRGRVCFAHAAIERGEIKALTPPLSRGEREYLRRRVCFAHAAIEQ